MPANNKEIEAYELASFVRSRREELGLSGKDLAAKCGVSSAAITRVEQGRIRSPSATFMVALAVGLETPTSELFEQAGIDISAHHRRPTRHAKVRNRLSKMKLTKAEEGKLLEYLAFLRTR